MQTPGNVTVAVMAAPPVRDRLLGWLRQARFHAYDALTEPPPADTPDAPDDASPSPAGGDGHRGRHTSALWAPTGGGALVTYLPDPGATAQAVTTEHLSRHPQPLLWLQLAPMTLEDAHFLARRARAASTTLYHAPYLHDPADHDRPSCLVYGPVAVTGRGRADALVRAVSHYARWTGPVENQPDPHHHPELLTLGERALNRPGRPTS